MKTHDDECPPSPLSDEVINAIRSMQSIVGQDDGNRGMKTLIVPDDLLHAATVMSRLTSFPRSHSLRPSIIILSGFPCCVHHNPPTETDGPPGAIAIARCALALGLNVTLVTDSCNEHVFHQAAGMLYPKIRYEIFSGVASSSSSSSSRQEEEEMQVQLQRMRILVEERCDLIVACERPGPSKDGKCYTMRGIDMNERGLIAPLHKIIDIARDLNMKRATATQTETHGGDKNGNGDGRKNGNEYGNGNRNSRNIKFIAIGDGGNELGMGKVIDQIRENPMIENGDKIAAVTKCDYLIAASVSNWGAYALVAACAIVKAYDSASSSGQGQNHEHERDWVEECVPTVDQEVKLLERCVAAGCRDGVSGEMVATVDGMSLEISMECLKEIRKTAKASYFR